MAYFQTNCTYKESYPNGVHSYTFTGPCFVTGKPYSVTVTGAGLHAYNNGALVNKAFPELSVEDREFLISGMSPEGWALTFG